MIIESAKLDSVSILPNGEFGLSLSNVKFKIMKIGLTGPSGSGKTTLANYIQELYPGVEFIPGSASLISNPESQQYLKNVFGYEPSGHKAVINKSNANPHFGLAFQTTLMIDRAEKLKSTEGDFVTDRTAVDNLTYFMLQCAHNQLEPVVENFIEEAKKSLLESGITHLFLVKPNKGWTEDNGSRVANNPYQHMVYAVFNHVVETYFMDFMGEHNIKFAYLENWDLDWRKERIEKTLKR